jgi:hypothetical protein
MPQGQKLRRRVWCLYGDEAGSLLKILITYQRGIVIIARQGGEGSSPKKRILHPSEKGDTYPIRGIKG